MGAKSIKAATGWYSIVVPCSTLICVGGTPNRSNSLLTQMHDLLSIKAITKPRIWRRFSSFFFARRSSNDCVYAVFRSRSNPNLARRPYLYLPPLALWRLPWPTILRPRLWQFAFQFSWPVCRSSEWLLRMGKIVRNRPPNMLPIPWPLCILAL